MEKIKVLMAGPDRSVHGGISGMVNNYYDAGLDGRIQLCYIGTMVEGSKLRKLFQAVKAFARFLAKLPFYQIVHVNMASDASYYRKSFFIRAAKLYGKKIVIHQHGGDFESFYYKEVNERGRRRIKKVLSMGDAFLVLTPVWRDFFSRLVDEGRIIILPNGIKMPAPAKKEYGGQQILFLGRLCREKGIGELLGIMPGLKEKYPGAHLYLGGIWEEEELKTIAGQCGDSVTWLGWVTGKEKEKYLQKCDIFVLPSYFEGQPVCILEAMSFGCAIAASKTGGIPYMVEEGRTGMLFQPRDPENLSRVLECLLSDKELCRRLGGAACQKAAKEFSIEENMEQLLSIYKSI